MKTKAILSTIIILVGLVGCSVTPERIDRHPAYNQPSTTGIGESIYTYDKQGKVFNDYMNAKNTNWSDSIKYELLYSGYSKGVLKLTYREFVNDLARASFYQDATYDYTGGQSEISFKGARILIIAADNNKIHYKVIQGFTGEQLKAKK